MYKLVASKRFKKDYRKLAKAGLFDTKLINQVIGTLMRGELLAQNFRDHALKGQLNGFRECHIKPDLLLIYRVYNEKSILELIRIGSHSQLF